MSVLKNLKSKVKEFSSVELLSLIDEYELKLKDRHKDISMKNKNIGDVIIQQPSLASYYDELKAELSTLCDYIKIMLDARAGEVTQTIKENSNYDYTPTALERMINNDKTYIEYKILFLEAKEIYNKAYYICKQFEQRSYLITNAVAIFEHEINDRILTLEYNEP
jgi:hypothetical protein